jgi:hypothetical protein
MADRSWRYCGSIEAHPSFYDFYARALEPCHGCGNVYSCFAVTARDSISSRLIIMYTSPARAQEHGHADNPWPRIRNSRASLWLATWYVICRSSRQFRHFSRREQPIRCDHRAPYTTNILSRKGPFIRPRFCKLYAAELSSQHRIVVGSHSRLFLLVAYSSTIVRQLYSSWTVACSHKGSLTHLVGIRETFAALGCAPTLWSSY